MSEKKIAICFASVPFVRGGAENHAESLCTELNKRGYKADIVSIPFQWEPKLEIIKNMVMWRLLNLDKISGIPVDLVIATKFPSYMIKHPNKVTWLFHQHRAIYDLYGTPYSDFNADDPEEMDIRDHIINADNKALRESKVIYTNSKNTGYRLKYYNNIDSTPLYHPPKHYGKYYCDDYQDYILSVGRLEGLKRVDLLLQAMQYTDKDIKCVIAGTGGMEGYLKNMARDLGIQNKVKFVGFVNDEELLKLYANCFAVYFAPYDEDYGYITLESFLSKKPLITCSDSGGVMEFAEHGINSFISEDASAESLGRYINELYNNTALCRKMGNNGYDKVKNINWDDVIKKLTCTL